MSNFLWVEDFEGNSTNGEIFEVTTNAVFGKELGNINEIDIDDLEKYLKKENIFLELTFLSSLEFIRDKDRLSKIDFIILDVDLMLKMKGDTDEHNYLPEILKNYQQILSKTPEIALKETAGYQLYVELVLNLDFPKDHILFCSNHGVQLDSIKEAFQNAKIDFPNDRLFTKSENEKIYNWISQRRHNPYHVLRRSIIAGCQQIKKQCEAEEIDFQLNDVLEKTDSTFVEMVKKDFINQLELLQRILPLREPKTNQEKKHLYRIVVRTLAHEWEKANDGKIRKKGNDKILLLYSFSTIMKCLRNWLAHTNLLNDLSEHDIAYFFLISMRAAYKQDTIQNHEAWLLSLINATNATHLSQLDTQELENKLLHEYEKLLNKCKPKIQEFKELDFISIAQKIQKDDPNNTKQQNYLNLLYQMFWYSFSPVITEKTQYDIKNKIMTATANCQVQQHDYQADPFLHQLALALYPHSFK